MKHILYSIMIIDEENKNTTKVLICRLSSFRDTSQSFTHTLLHRIISSAGVSETGIAYFPEFIPSFSNRPAKEFNVLAISNSLVQELLNIPVLLGKCGVETDYEKRMESESQPLVIMGGSNAANSHFIMHVSSPVDLVYTGEDPETVRKFFERINGLKNEGKTKIEICGILFEEFPVVHPLKGESNIKDVVSNRYMREIQPAGVPLLNKDDPNSTPLVISRGCPWFCSFCNESFRTKPYFEASVHELEESALTIKRENGSDELSLFSFNFNAHSKIDEIIAVLHRYFRVVSLMSQRFDVLAKRPELLRILQHSGKNSITCGLEGISDRLRSYLSKDLNREELENGLGSILNSPVRALKIFLIATGLENEDDYSEFGSLLSFIKKLTDNRPRPPRVVFSLTHLVRFPGTPQGTEKAYPPEVMQKITDRLSSAVNAAGFEFRTAGSVYEYFVSQILLRNGSEEFYNAVMRTVNETGFSYYDKVTNQFYDKLVLNLRELSPDTDSFLNSGLELTHFNSNLSAAFIKEAAKRMNAFTDTPTCSRIKEKDASCRACGACSSTEERSAATEYAKGRSLTVDELKKIQAEYNSGTEVELPVVLSEKCSGLSDRYLSAVVSSALYRSVPGSEVYVKRLLRFASRTRFGNDRLSGVETAVFLCAHNEAAGLKEHTGTEIFAESFSRNAQGFCTVRNGNGQKNHLHITIRGEKKIDNSFVSGFHIKSTVVKVSEGVYEAQVSKDGLKKKQFSSVTVDINNNSIDVAYGEKFDLNGFIKAVRDRYKIKTEHLVSVLF